MNARIASGILFFLLLFAFSACSGFKWNGNEEVTAGSVSTNAAAIPIFTPGAGSYNTAQAVVVTTSTPGATICYTTNATNPDCNATTGVCTVGTTYSGPVAIPVTQTLMAIACKAAMTNSPIQTGVYTLDTILPVISAVAPVAAVYVTNTQVSYTLSEQCSTAKITWTRTGGAADASSPHVQPLVGAELTTGAHNNIVIANNPTLIAGAIYSISFDCTDLASNVGTTVTSANVTFDNVPPVISSTTPASGAFVNTTQVSYTLSKNCASASITWTQTGGTVDPGSPRVQALVGGEMTAGAHNGITLSNNPALVSGAIYSLAYNCTDAAGQTATPITNTGVTFDNVAPIISAITPASATAVNHTKVSYTLSENCTTATIKWTQTGGVADGASPHTQSLVGAELTTGAHNNFVITNNPTLVNGAIYTVAFDCSDAAGNNAATVSATNVTYNTIAVAISAVAPATNAYVNNTKVSYTYSAACATATITWTRTAGAADGGSPHAQSLAGAELAVGSHTNITLASNPVLADGAVYTLQFDCTDAALNASTPIVITGVTYDVTAPVISAVSPVASAYVNTTKVGYTLSEVCATATITWIRTSGTADGASPHAQTLVAPEMTAGVHAAAT
ncbi:MAG: chitobiase/beta-hexosaminidase C-terminal domain-containing protein, partial [Spirochaetes bacterium]|nr:chitobiase/beta-hexosaminidase C-terminal domain-containing protein [Spirochaetota bacterium]